MGGGARGEEGKRRAQAEGYKGAGHGRVLSVPNLSAHGGAGRADRGGDRDPPVAPDAAIGRVRGGCVGGGDAGRVGSGGEIGGGGREARSRRVDAGVPAGAVGAAGAAGAARGAVA